MHDPTHEYDENCPGCQPAMLNLETGQPVPADDPSMVIVSRVFKSFSLAERRAWHRVIMQNSQNENDWAITKRISDAVSGALNAEQT